MSNDYSATSIPDIDEVETQEWLESLEAVLDREVLGHHV